MAEQGHEDTPSLFDNVISHSIATVPEVLEEWEFGLSGKPCISSIEGKWSNKWRMGTKNQKNFSR